MSVEVYDALGKIVSYSLEFGDSVNAHQRRERETGDKVSILEVARGNNRVIISGRPGNRSLLVENPFRISNYLDVSEKEISEQISEVQTGVSTSRAEVESRIRKQKLKRISDESLEAASEKAQKEVKDVDSAVQSLYYDDSRDLWDGFAAQTRLYPGTDEFSIRTYNEAVKQVIQDGQPVAQAIYNELDELGQDVVPEDGESDGRTVADRMFE